LPFIAAFVAQDGLRQLFESLVAFGRKQLGELLLPDLALIDDPDA
jgi:hypothetical protein